MNLIAINYDEIISPGCVREGAPFADWMAKLNAKTERLEGGSLKVDPIPCLQRNPVSDNESVERTIVPQCDAEVNIDALR